MTTNHAHRGRRLLTVFWEEFELVGRTLPLERFLLCYFLLFLQGPASEVFQAFEDFLTGGAFEGGIDGITVIRRGATDSHTNLGGFRRVDGDGGNLGHRAATTGEVVFGESGLSVLGVHFNFMRLDVIPILSQVEDTGGETGDVELGESIQGSDFTVLLDELQDTGLLVVCCFCALHNFTSVIFWQS